MSNIFTPTAAINLLNLAHEMLPYKRSDKSDELNFAIVTHLLKVLALLVMCTALADYLMSTVQKGMK